jgi:predicted MPP superfamily phosphohydrolase
VTPLHVFWIASAASWFAVVVAARIRRGRLFSRFAGILVGVHTLIACGLARHMGVLFPAYCVLQAVLYVHFFCLSRPRMRSLVYRIVISIPASFFSASTVLALPWAVAALFGATPHLLWIPYALGFLGLVESLTLRREEIDLVLDRAHVDGVRRHPRGTAASAGRPLRIIQITDPHLGPFMSVQRLRAICERAVAKAPDLVLLTGDFLTMESQDSVEHLAVALAPLEALRGKVFACHGNHDHEAPELVATALRRIGATLLVDRAALIQTEAGPVQIVGMDYHFHTRKERMARVCAEYPRIPGAFRLVLLHNPGAFRDLPVGEGDLVLSGHTHGGQLGLVTLGFPPTILRLFVDMPDHGLWARGSDRLYVHRGTGHYGFPLRLGVPAEESLVRVHLA